MSTSEAQIAANRRNALRSTGPSAAEGKLRSAKNAIKHGVYSQTSVLFNEDREDYDRNTQAFLDKFEPQDDVERRLVERMADCEWRLIRARYIEAATLDLQLDETEELVEERFESIDEPSRLAYALQLLDPAQSSTYTGVQRQESRLHRQYERAYRLLHDMRKQQQACAQKKTSQIEPIPPAG
jgi:hypothetical protein